MSRKVIYLTLGFFFLLLGGIGAVLPILPTTPFLILSAYFFSQSSQRLYSWLLNLPWAGSIIKTWEEERAIKKEVKIFAVTMVLFVTATSYWSLLEKPFLFRGILLVLASIGVGVILAQKTQKKKPD